jgi:hypothetical protein
MAGLCQCNFSLHCAPNYAFYMIWLNVTLNYYVQYGIWNIDTPGVLDENDLQSRRRHITSTLRFPHMFTYVINIYLLFLKLSWWWAHFYSTSTSMWNHNFCMSPRAHFVHSMHRTIIRLFYGMCDCLWYIAYNWCWTKTNMCTHFTNLYEFVLSVIVP